MGNLFIGGRDTKPEIDALAAAFEIKPGLDITHEDVAKAAGLEVGSTRFMTVCNRWRKLIERTTHIRVTSSDKVFHFLTPDEAFDQSRSDFHRVGKAVGKVSVRVGVIDTNGLTPERRATHAIMSREAAAVLDSVRRSAKAIAGPAPLRPSNLRIAK